MPEKIRRIRISDDLWRRLGEAIRDGDPDANRSSLIRRFVRWYVGDSDDLPRRPAPRRAAQEDSPPGQAGGPP